MIDKLSEEMWRRLTSWLRDNCHAKISVGRQEGCECGTCQAADMIDALRTELTAARTVGLENYNRACRERDSARADALEEAAKEVESFKPSVDAQLAKRVCAYLDSIAQSIRALKPVQGEQ